MHDFFIYLSKYPLGAARGPPHRDSLDDFFICLYVGPDIRVRNATMAGACPGIPLFMSTVRSDGLRCRALRMRTIHNPFIHSSFLILTFDVHYLRYYISCEVIHVKEVIIIFLQAFDSFITKLTFTTFIAFITH